MPLIVQAPEAARLTGRPELAEADTLLEQARDVEGAEVEFGDLNEVLIRPLPEHRPGTMSYRFSRLLEELDKRFPKGASHRRTCGEPPELHLLREIDERLGLGKKQPPPTPPPTRKIKSGLFG